MTQTESLWETAPSDAVEAAEWEGPSQEDWDWYIGEFYVDPAERVW